MMTVYEFGRVQNHLGYQYSRTCHQIHWEVLRIESEQWPKTPCQFSQGVYKGKEMESLRLPKSISRFKSDWTWISPAEEERKGKTPQNKQQLELAALKAGKSISKDETKSLVMSMGHRLTAVTANREILSLLFQYLWRALYIYSIYIYICVCNVFSHVATICINTYMGTCMLHIYVTKSDKYIL